MWILNKNKKARVVEQNGKQKRYRNRENEILFMDLRQMGSPFEKKYTELTEDDIAKVTEVYHNWHVITSYSIHYTKLYEQIDIFFSTILPCSIINFSEIPALF